MDHARVLYGRQVAGNSNLTRKASRTEAVSVIVPCRFQDSPIVCRLRRNTEFRSGDGTNWASSSQGPQSITGEENHAASVGDTEIPTNIGEEFMRRTTSSYGSYSAEQIESTSESNQKSMHEAAVTESLTQPKVCWLFWRIPDAKRTNV